MSIHMQNKNKRPDEDFIKGEMKYLVNSNRCRLLDGRRTPGIIKDVDIDKAMFTFLIGDYEDKGKTWTLYANKVHSFQFERGSKTLDKTDLLLLQKQITHYKQPLIIDARKDHKTASLSKISQLQKDIMVYLQKQGLTLPYHKESKTLQEALIAYMDSHGLGHIEEQISRQMVINPNAGELSKAIAIALAHLGLKSYKGTILRTRPYDQTLLEEYLLKRIAFTRSLFTNPLTVFRGMSSEAPLKTIPRTFLSYTDSLDVAKAFTEFEDPKYKSVYLLKKQARQDELFMTHYETKAFHETYQEKEVILFHLEDIII